MDILWAIIARLGEVLAAQLPWALGLAAMFTVLAVFSSQTCNPGKPWWKNRGLLTDAEYGLILPIVMPYLRICLIILVVALARGSISDDDIVDFMQNGRGPVSHLPLWGQAIFYLLATDFLLYWSHRLFHGMHLWPFHAVHHSSEDVDWTSAYRFHPVNTLLGSTLVSLIMIGLGVSPVVMVALVPFDIITAAFVHSNLKWTLGPLKYVVATPVFHRWHHSHPDDGGMMNYAPTFAFWDVMFGTFYMPEGKLPQEYGTFDPDFPKDFAGQIIVPFKQFFQSFRSKPKTPQDV